MKEGFSADFFINDTKYHPCPRDPGKNTIPKGPCLELPEGQGPQAWGPRAAPGRGPRVWYFSQEPEGKEGILSLLTGKMVFQFKFSRSCLFATHVILIVLNLRIPWLQYNATHVILIVLNLRIPWPAHVILIVLNPRIPWPAHGILRFSTIKITWIAWYPG